MSWDPTYSFGTPSAQPPTPTKTPISAAFPSPTFQTPRNNSSSFENRSGWTPTFAEEYSVFNATPGRLTAQNPFVETPRPIERQILGSSGDISKGFATHDSNLSPVLPHSVNSSNQLPSTGGDSSSRSRFDDASKRQVTPQKPKKRLEEAFSGQTATPPNTVSKGSRRLAPKLSNTMDHDSQNGQYDPLGTPSQQSFMPFPTTSTDLFGQPMSAPATAPVFNSNSFWDPNTSMGGMDMEFTPESAVFNTNLNTTSHRPANSFDWGRTNQLFQDTVNMPQPQTRTQEPAPQPVKRQRALAPKVSAPPPAIQPTSLPPFDFGKSPTSEDPFAATNMGGIVNPGLLFSRHSNSSSISERNLESGFEDVMMPPTRPATSQLVLEPYAHQRRESRRDQEELRRARSMRENGSFRFDKGRGILSSPVKGSARPAMHRSVSDSKGKRGQGKRQLPPAPKVTGPESRSHPRGGRVSPVKQALNNLHSIPESPDRRARTEVKFTIDSNGRARTETVVIVDEPQTRPARRASSLVHGDDWNSSSYESSSDDEPIIIPSQNNSFTLPGQRGPKYPRFEASHGIPDGRRSSASGSSYNQSDSSRYSGRYDGHDSEAETVMDDEDGDGDATRELRKVMESRKQSPTKGLRDPRHHHFLDTSRPGMQYGNYGSSTTSPTEGATPSSSRSGTTRCVCNKPDGDGFMIQCESCDNWLHGPCVGIDHRSLPPVYICAFCANTPNNIRGIRKSIPARGSNLAPLASPLAHKSFKSFR